MTPYEKQIRELVERTLPCDCCYAEDELSVLGKGEHFDYCPSKYREAVVRLVLEQRKAVETEFSVTCPRCTFKFNTQGACLCVCHEYPQHQSLQDALDALEE